MERRIRFPKAIKRLMAPWMIAIAWGAVCLELLAQEVGLNVTEETIWHQDYDPKSKSLGVKESEGFCYLTMVRGKFEGRGEQVRVFVTNGHWRVGGKSRQEGVAAGARCVIWAAGKNLDVKGEWRWRQGEWPDSLIEEKEGFCYLTRMTGKFLGGGEAVQVFRKKGRWKLGGRSSQEGVEAGARCVEWPYKVNSWKDLWEEHWWSQNLPNQAPISLDVGEDEGFCYLTTVTGKFRGGGEAVRVYISGRTWKLGGESRQEGVAAGARCVKFE